MLADNKRGMITTKNTKPRPVASAHPIKIAGGGKQICLYDLDVFGGGGSDDNNSHSRTNQEDESVKMIVFFMNFLFHSLLLRILI